MPAALLALALGLAAPSPPNGLAGESSAYLLAHARNPVRWVPWGPDAFAEAKRRNVPVFLSVGYSSCHWCHVMERESFADRSIAALLNRHFVCVKVDREERPDVDEVYLAALVAGTGRGGWPMSMFLMPDGTPITGGTYWPPRDRPAPSGVVLGFETVLKRVTDAYRTRPADLAAQAKQLAERTRADLGRAKLDPAPLTAVLVSECAESFDLDPEFGGFGVKFAKYAGPKFPRVPSLLFLLRQSQKPQHAKLAPLVRLTLDKMATGGVRDQLAGGFHRYSTERTWAVPHFEKMLYDQAQLMELYAESARLTGSATDRLVARSTLDFCRRELKLPSGFYAASVDADSAPPNSPGAHPEEGAFYAWTPAELNGLLGSDPATLALRARLGLTGSPNFDGRFTLTPVRGERLFARGADPVDGVLPSPSNLMLSNLARLAQPSPGPQDAGILKAGLGRRARLMADSPAACPVAAGAVERALSDGPP